MDVTHATFSEMSFFLLNTMLILFVSLILHICKGCLCRWDFTVDFGAKIQITCNNDFQNTNDFFSRQNTYSLAYIPDDKDKSTEKLQQRYASLFVIMAHITRVVVSRCISSK